MHKNDAILDTLRMLQEEKLDVRTATLGISLEDCSSPNPDQLAEKIHQKIVTTAGDLVRSINTVERQFGIPVVNKRIAVSPIAMVASGHSEANLVRAAKAMDQAAADVGVDLIGGFSANMQKATSQSAQRLLNCLPEALVVTDRVCSALQVATSRAGINMDAVNHCARTIHAIAHADADNQGFAAAKLVVFANLPEDNPFMAGASHGTGEGDAVINIGVSGPGVVKRAIERLIENDQPAANNTLSLIDLAEEIKITAFRITRVGELIGRELADLMGIRFGIVDLSLAPTPAVGDSVGEILQAMGILNIGAPGSTAAVAMLNDAVKKGGAFASSSVGGLSGAFIPVMEDSTLAQAVADGHLCAEKLEAMTSVCSVGLDMLPVPGDTSTTTLAGMIADEMAIGVTNNKTTATRIIPVPGKQVGDSVRFGGLFGASQVMAVRSSHDDDRFCLFGGRIPAPLHSLKN
jgi:uncharacterized protein (UPF0210 family)